MYLMFAFNGKTHQGHAPFVRPNLKENRGGPCTFCSSLAEGGQRRAMYLLSALS